MLKTIPYAIKAISQRGVGFLFTYFKESMWFDLRHGTKTSSRVPKEEQSIDTGSDEVTNGLLYVASFTSVVKKSLGVAKKMLGAERYKTAHFIDLGCGKGKTLLVYALAHRGQGTPRAVGIEYDPTLTVQAKENVEHCGLSTNEIEIYTDSAVNVLEYMQSETLIIYLYNSFQGETLRQVLEQLKDTPHVLIYVDPAERTMLPDFGYVIEHEATGKYNADTWLVARSAALTA